MLRPNRAYSATFSCCISSRSSPMESSSLVTSVSIFSVDAESIPCASDRGSWKNESPILYLDGAVSDDLFSFLPNPPRRGYKKGKGKKKRDRKRVFLTAQAHLHQQVPIPLKPLPSPPYPSVNQLATYPIHNRRQGPQKQ